MKEWEFLLRVSNVNAVAVQDSSKRIICKMDAEREDLDTLFAQLDSAASASRQLLAGLPSNSNASITELPASLAVTSSESIVTQHDLNSPASTVADSSAADTPAHHLQELLVPDYIHIGDPLVNPPRSTAGNAELADTDGLCSHVNW
jgi:hypothetical protein